MRWLIIRSRILDQISLTGYTPNTNPGNSRARRIPMETKTEAVDNNAMHAKPGLRVVLKWMIAGSGSVIADDYEVPTMKSRVWEA